jgi:hypothetical protein
MKQATITPQFVDLMPGHLQEGVLYISEKYGTAIHKCCCGCGQKVVTPLSPAKWQLRRDGDTVTLYPSIGNWNFPCRSHYWIRRNRIEWAGLMSDNQIRRVQERDQRDSQRYIEQVNAHKAIDILNRPTADQGAGKSKGKTGLYVLWHWIGDWWNH